MRNKAYRGRDPKAPFIVNDNYEKYALSKREKDGARYNDIRDFSGIKTKKSLDGEIRPHEAELESVMNNLFRNL